MFSFTSSPCFSILCPSKKDKRVDSHTDLCNILSQAEKIYSLQLLFFHQLIFVLADGAASFAWESMVSF